jgi:hypothetical protein
MAHAGTTLRQPAATGTGRGLWIALITGAVILAIASAVVMAQLMAAPKAAGGSVAADRSYDQIEAQRGAIGTADGSYDQIEKFRGGTVLPLVDPADHGYDALHPATGPALLDRGADRDNAPAVQFKHAPGKGPLQ